MTILEIVLIVIGIVLVIYYMFLLKKTQNYKNTLEAIVKTPVRAYTTPIQLETIRGKIRVSRYDMQCININDIKTVVREKLANNIADYIKDKIVIEEVYDEDASYIKYETTIKVYFGRKDYE